MSGQSHVLALPDPVERRRHTRYRFTEAIVVRRKDDGASARATTSEISISGLSATTTLILAVGDSVELSPIGGASVTAIVRRCAGSVFGFEFIDPPDQVVQNIHSLCRGLFPFRGAEEYPN
jgi:hypothetical protein